MRDGIFVLAVSLLLGCTGGSPHASGVSSATPDTGASASPSAIATPTGGGSLPSVMPLDLGQLSGRIVFSAGNHPDDEIYVIGARGGTVTRLTDDPASDFDPTWSPDGTQIAWRTERVGGEDEIFVMNADGSNQHNLTRSPAEDYAPDRSPDGRLIAYASDRNSLPNLWVINPDGSGATQVTDEIGGEYASWSPDSRSFVFVVDTDFEPALSNARAGWDLYVVDVDTSATRRLTSGAGSEKGPAWSPDGGEIVFEFAAEHGALPELWLISADGSDMRPLVSRGYAPAWSSDGRFIVFSTGSGLAVVSRDGTERATLPTGSLVEPVFADWTP